MTEPGEREFASTLAAAQRGEAVGFDGLVRLVDRRLVGFAQARGADDPEGLANDVLVQACRSIGDFEGNLVQFRAWVFTIARNRLIDEHRRYTRRVASTPTEPESMPEPAMFEPFGEMEQRERMETMLEGLTDEQREVILLRVVGGLSVTETAEVIGRRAGAVRALQHRALTQLRSRMSEQA